MLSWQGVKWRGNIGWMADAVESDTEDGLSGADNNTDGVECWRWEGRHGEKRIDEQGEYMQQNEHGGERDGTKGKTTCAGRA